jgi:acetate kinase
VAISDQANQAARGDPEIGSAGHRVRTLVVHAREDLEIARQARRLVANAKTVN